MSSKTIGIIVIVALLLVLVVASAFVFKKSKAASQGHLPTPCTPPEGGQGQLINGTCVPIKAEQLPGINVIPR